MANPLTQLAHLFLDGVQADDLQMRSIELAASFNDQINVLTRQRGVSAWRVASVDEALGVPAIWGAVTLIADTVGSLSLEGFRNEQILPATDRPRLIVRPNPFSTPRAFFRDSAFYLSTRGEAWWWVAARDTDGAALSLYPVPPWEITVTERPRDRLRPLIEWAGREMRNEDMRQITYMPNGLRGQGPLQACGAALSVAVESQTWAANFFGGNIPSLVAETEQDMDESEMKALKEQWLETEDANLPRFVTNGLKLHLLEINPEQAQLTDTRQHSVGDAARMFSMPGSLIEYQMSGSSLRYQNDQSIWTDFLRRCLSPHYLEPIEQEISDLLTRSTVGRFNVKQLLRADPKTRMEVHQLAIGAGIYDAATAAAEEGYAPGNVDYAPIPLALPAAIPSQLPIQGRSQSDGFRCSGCNRKLAESAGTGTVIRCRCGEVNAGPELEARSEAPQINVHPAPVTVHPAEVNVTIEAGAIAPPDMSGMVQAISDLAARNEAPAVHFEAGAFQSDMHVPELVIPEPAPVEPPIVNVLPDPSFVEAIDRLQEMLAQPRNKTIVRNEEGRIIGVQES